MEGSWGTAARPAQLPDIPSAPVTDSQSHPTNLPSSAVSPPDTDPSKVLSDDDYLTCVPGALLVVMKGFIY